MASIRSNIFRFVLKHRHLFSKDTKRIKHFTADTPIEDFRAQVNKAHKLFGKLPKGIRMEEEKIGDLYCERIIKLSADTDKIILYFHGGGYVSGTCEAHRIHVAKVVNYCNINAFVFEYRVAPENPFPAALEDALIAYKYLLENNFNSNNIVFMGDSAGGGLLLSLLNKLKAENLPLPVAAVALSPWTDLSCSGESYVKNLKVEPFAPKESWVVFSNYYVQKEDVYNPFISPIYGDLKKLPPLKIFVGGHETMLSDSVDYAQKAKEAGVEVELTVGEKLFHCYPICAPVFPEATKAMKEIAGFFNKHLSDKK